MKRKQTLLVAMTALFCAFGVGRLWAATAADITYLNTNVRIESITKRVPTNTAYPVGTEVYFDVKLADKTGQWVITGNSYDATSGARPYLMLDMPLKGNSTKPAMDSDPEAEVSTDCAVAYYVGSTPSAANSLRFAYVVRPGDMSTNITWDTNETGAPAFSDTISSIALTVVTQTGPIDGGKVNLSSEVMQGTNTIEVPDTGATIPVSGYTFTVGDADNNNMGMLYAGLVPVTVNTIKPESGVRSITDNKLLYTKCYFWVEDEAGNQYHNVGVTSLTSDKVVIKEGNNDTPVSAAFPEAYAAKLTGMNTAAFAGQKFMVSVPAALAGQNVRLCYGVSRANAETQTTYAYETYTVEASPVTTVTKSYKVSNVSMKKGSIALPGDGIKYANLLNQSVVGGSVTLGSGETTSFTIEKNGVSDLADYGTLYASIEMISSSNDASAEFERYYVPIAADGTYKVKLSIKDTDTVGTTYYRVRVPALESANGVGTEDEPFYLAVTSSPKREKITLLAGATGGTGTEYYQPADATAGQTPGTANILEYTLSVAAADEPRNFLIYPTDVTYTHRIDKNATMVGLTDANGAPLNAYNMIASVVSLQTQSSGVLSDAAELRVTVPAGETSVKFYVRCVNDFVQSKKLLSGKANVADSATEVDLNGIFFVAKTCDSDGNITGLLDECYPIAPVVSNRAPSIVAAFAPTNATTGAVISFSFDVADATGDYLLLTMNYGDGAKDSVLLVDETKMIATMGKANWDAELANLKNLYGTGTAKELKIEARSLDQQQYTFSHAYTSGATQNWHFAVIDSSRGQSAQTGVITLETAQQFIFNTIYNPTLPASGYIVWDNGTDALNNWSFGTTYTLSSLPKNGGNTLVTVAAKPFPADYLQKNPADAATLSRFNGPSDQLDSFFYKWSANSDFEGILPTGATEEYRRYEEILTFSRAYVKDGEADDATKWQDIQLSAIFVAEYLPGDSISSRNKDSSRPYLYELGDYNQDGVPDGWVLKHMGEASRATLIEGTSVAEAFPGVEEYLPFAGFGNGDSAYRFGASAGRLGYSNIAANYGPCTMGPEGVPFGYKLRLRGRDDALNAADGQGNWLSVPAWIVLVHPEQADGIVKAGAVNEAGVFTPEYRQLRLSSSTTSPVKDVEVAFTAANKIPYDAASVVNGWAYVLDEAGYPVKSGAVTLNDGSTTTKYRANNVMVNVDEAVADYEAFRYTYDQWGVDNNGAWVLESTEAGALYPFTTKAEADAAMTGNVDAYKGAQYRGAYRFVDARAVAGMLIDEPFNQTPNEKELIDPRLTSWLDRFAGTSDDIDGDGIKNAAEYYFWYYASRIAYGSVFSNDEGVQLNTALWPAIDLRNRKEWNTDTRFKTSEKFTMGRRFNNDFDPDSTAENSFYGPFEADEFSDYVFRTNYAIGDATRGKGNYWVPIAVEAVMNAFDPYTVINNNAYGDLDNDGLLVVEELAAGTNPIDCDTDNDWMIDGFEVAQGLDPFNVVNKSDPNDAEHNPDGDYYAAAVVRPYPEFHHLFKVEYDDGTTPAPGATNVVENVYYYDYEDSVVRAFEQDDTFDIATSVLTDAVKTIPWNEAEANVTGWADEAPVFVEVPSVPVRLRDHEVYRAFGFNPGTGWGKPTAGFSKYPRLSFTPVNTESFVSREEFFSAHKYKGWKSATSVTSADTNNDGAPDGWELYTGFDPVNTISPDGPKEYDADGLTVAQEYVSAAGNLVARDSSWPDSLISEVHDNHWTNKLLPTDPWNPDTDLDGLWDGAEGATRLIYGAPDWNAYVGGGCDPNTNDTDSDGMPDAWEVRYFTPPASGAANAPYGEVTHNGVTLALSGTPDPTVSGYEGTISEYDFDYDLDGLTNYQEYQIGFLRHLRYDLGPDAARLHKETFGKQELSPLTDQLEWTELPDVYVATVDMMNPSSVSSLEYMDRASNNAPGAVMFLQSVDVNPLKQAISASKRVSDKQRITTTSMMLEGAADGITTAFNYNWAQTIAFPLLSQLDENALSYKLAAVKKSTVGADVTKIAQQRALALATAFHQFDMAYRRLLSTTAAAGTQFGKGACYDRLVWLSKDYDLEALQQKSLAQVRALMGRIDLLITLLAEDAAQGNLGAVLTEMLQTGGDTPTIWAARKNQVLKVMAESLLTVVNPVYTDIAAISNGAYTRRENVDYATARDSDISAYEEAVWNATSPLLQQRYREAVRGFSGGLCYDTPASLSAILSPLGWHAPVKPFGERKEKAKDSQGAVLGLPIVNEMNLAANKLPSNPSFPTTSPLDADSDLDGMDDYFEVFHGLNPILGDYESDSVQNDSSLATVDAVSGALDHAQPRSGDVNLIYYKPKASGILLNPFGNKPLSQTSPTGYDYYTYPWMAGLPQADPDGDGLLNSEEAVNPVTSAPAHYGTDPSALWMTDPANPNSFVTRFYNRTNTNAIVAGLGTEDAVPLPFYGLPNYEVPLSTASNLPYEVNEGYDTDGDGVGDLVELSSNSIFRGDPQTLRTPDRQQAAYFGGEGAFQTMEDTQFGPQALTTFTIECWVKPEADQAYDEVILIDRPWRFNDGSDLVGALRHNFVMGLRKEGAAFRPFAYYTGSGTNVDGTESTPQASPRVTAGQIILPNEWNHIAVTYDGTRLVLMLNGVESAAQTSGLIPANGVISLKSTVDSDVRRFTFRKAPVMIGAAPAQSWTADLGNPEDDSLFSDYFTQGFKGFIDEVRIWNGARSMAQIAEARSRNLTQSELLTLRFNAFQARYNGMGYYQPDTPAEPLAIYTFNDLLAGSRTPATETSPAQTNDYAWERFPGDQLTGDASVAGSFMFRRSGFLKTRDGEAEANNARLTKDNMPEEEELFTSYYTLLAAPNLRSKQYAENREIASKNLATGDVPVSEFVPMAHNTVAHLPLADVQRVNVHNYGPETLKNGSPELLFPSGTAEHVKVADSFYWSPYRSGAQIATSPIYNVKTAGNPYGYRYHGSIYFDVQDYLVRSAFSTQVPTDLLIYGDVYARYDAETWDNSPTTDPSGAKTDSEAISEGPDWFRHQDTPNADTGDKLNDKQFSQGGYWLNQNIANSQTKDSDEDRMPNWWENYYGLDPENRLGINGPHGDQDGDMLTNYAEYLASANPLKFSTVGNGVPDSQIPIWFRRGAPTFALLYTDNDFMEDHWEASNRSERLSVDLHDGYRDADNDGWSNFAEARANFRSGYHSTNPNVATSISQTGKVTLEMPTPALRMTVDYFGDQNVYTNAVANAKIVVQTYTAKNNNSAPDATFNLPLVAGEGETEATVEHEIGAWQPGKMSGYLHIGNIKPGSLEIVFTRMAVDKVDSDKTGNEKEEDQLFFTIHSDTMTSNDIASLYYMQPVQWIDEEGNMVANGATRLTAGTINYRTGEYTLDFSDAEVWSDKGYYEDEQGLLTLYNRAEFMGVATYEYGVMAGKSNTYTLVSPDEGYIKEGANNFFVFADLDADGKWDDGEPAGVPDQHDVEIGFDQVNETLHVALTEQAPPGAVRLDVASILGVLMTENDTNTEVSGDLSSIINPSTQRPLNPSYFVSDQNYWLVLTSYERIGGTTVKDEPGAEVYRKQFNVNKPYLSEDEIFGNAETRTGLPRSEAENQVAASYKVYLLPETQVGNHESWMYYNIAVVTNVFGSLDSASTAMVAPVGGAYLHNADLAFEWKSNVQVPAFGLTITKVADAAGNPVNKVVFQDDDIRGVTPSGTASGTGAVEQFIYRYKLPRGIGELSQDRQTLFGDGAYTYALALHPYSGSAKTLTGSFNIQMNASGDSGYTELEGAAMDTTFNAQDSYYVRARIRYNGVLTESKAHFGLRNFVVEAHYSGSFNGNPVASTTDKLVYDAEDAATAALNRCVKMEKDKDDGEFFSTCFSVELRGLSTQKPVYLMAYFDLNANGKRDVWEPWGYATQGLDAIGGFYFDPLAVTPKVDGTGWQTEFYIQDMDADNDKLSDAWEWVSNGKPTEAFFDDGKTVGWCNTFTGAYGDLASTKVIWTTSVSGGVALTAYGAQLYGLTVEGAPDANGAVKVEGVEDMAAAQELLAILGDEVALELIKQGYSTYGLSVNNIAYNGDVVTLAWQVDSAVGTDGAVYDLTEVFAEGKNLAATYTVYGTATLGGKWTKLAEVKVAGAQMPAVEIPVADTVITDGNGTEMPANFFKVILSATPLSTTLE